MLKIVPGSSLFLTIYVASTRLVTKFLPNAILHKRSSLILAATTRTEHNVFINAENCAWFFIVCHWLVEQIPIPFHCPSLILADIENKIVYKLKADEFYYFNLLTHTTGFCTNFYKVSSCSVHG